MMANPRIIFPLPVENVVAAKASFWSVIRRFAAIGTPTKSKANRPWTKRSDAECPLSFDPSLAVQLVSFETLKTIMLN
jgi:hypothetical protein